MYNFIIINVLGNIGRNEKKKKKMLVHSYSKFTPKTKYFLH